MSIRTLVVCDRCARESFVEGQANEAGLKQYGYETVLNHLLCADCLKAVTNYINIKAPRPKDSGFTDGREQPEPKKRG